MLYWEVECSNKTKSLSGLLHNLNKTNQQQSTEIVGQKIAVLLKDDHIAVRVKAATALGYMFGNLV